MRYRRLDNLSTAHYPKMKRRKQQGIQHNQKTYLVLNFYFLFYHSFYLMSLP